ncbi:MAG: histone-lysine N-methyltransferase [Nanoarchaeota archaeon]
MAKLKFRNPNIRKIFADVKPNLIREQFPFDRPPRILFDSNPPSIVEGHQMWITDTTFRDGQQSRPPYTPEQIRDLYVLMSRLDNGTGTIRQSEFFLYSPIDRKALQLCRQENLNYPEITGWIRAVPADFALVKEMGLKETGILTSISDYHIYLKMGLTRKTFIDKYMAVVDKSIESGILPRCHLEDVTRADFYRSVIPFVQRLMKTSEDAKVQIKIRLCDTMGFGVSYPEAALPRSIPKIIGILRKECGVSPDQLEWHGHNDFHKVAANAEAAWLYGCSAVNGTLAGVGERTGNPPLEGMIMLLTGLADIPIKQTEGNGIDMLVISELAKYLKSTGMEIPKNYPLIGDGCNTTCAGIHADGAIKNEEIYQTCDMGSLVGKPLRVAVTNVSGIAGIVRWTHENIDLKVDGYKIGKDHPGVAEIGRKVSAEYDEGRTLSMSDEEMHKLVLQYIPEASIYSLAAIQQSAANYVSTDFEKPINKGALKKTQHVKSLADNPLVAAAYITDKDGRIITFAVGEESRYMYNGIKKGSYLVHPWHHEVTTNGNTFISELFKSRMTNALCMTIAAPISDSTGSMMGIYNIDLNLKQVSNKAD